MTVLLDRLRIAASVPYSPEVLALFRECAAEISRLQVTLNTYRALCNSLREEIASKRQGPDHA